MRDKKSFEAKQESKTKHFVSTIRLVRTDTNYFYGTSWDEGNFFPFLLLLTHGLLYLHQKI